MTKGAKLAAKLGQTATPAQIQAAAQKYKLEAARIEAAFAAEELRACDAWCQKTGGTRAEYIELQNQSEIWREKMSGA